MRSRIQTIRWLMVCAAAIALATGAARGQGSRKDDIVLNAQGRPVAGATITVCTGDSTTIPCSPLATLYTDATLTITSPNPFAADGLGNYHFYAAPGRYTVQIGGPGITTYSTEDVILPNDPTQPSFSSVNTTGGISASTLSLGGNLTVSGSSTISGDETVSGLLTAGSFNITNFMPSSLVVTGNEGVKGPQPRVDVTAYGALGNGVADDTAAIQAAITAACQNTTTGGGVIYFPPTKYGYLVSQPQNPSTSPVFTITGCTTTGVTFEGGGSATGAAQQFSRSPMTRVIVHTLGSSPNNAPVFLVGQSNSLVTFRNLEIYGYNQALQINNAVGTVLDNVALAVVNVPGGQTNCTSADCTTDNTPLAIYSSFWIWANQLALQVGPPGGYAAIFANVNNQNAAGLIRFDKVTAAGGGFLFDQRDSSSFSTGNYEFHTVATESAGSAAFFTVLNTGGGTTNRNIGPFQFENSAAYDCSAGKPFLLMNAAHVTLTTVHLVNSSGCNTSAPISVQAGAISSAVVDGGAFISNIPLDASNNPTGPVATDNLNGRDYVTPTTDTNRLRTDFATCCGLGSGADGSPIRMAAAGSKQATVALDPGTTAGQGGLLFGDGSNAGYNANLLEQSGNDDALDVAFAQSLPPTGVSANAGSGGSCNAGTYYYVISAYSGSTATQSTASAEVNATVAASGETTLNWTPSIGPNVTGYVVTRGATSGGEYGGAGQQYVVTPGSANTFTDMCATTTSGSPPRWNQTFTAYHRFSQRKLGVNNTAPAAQLDVTAQDASTVGASVKAAASPTANVWQVVNSSSSPQAYVDGGFNFVTAGHLNRPGSNSDVAGKITITSSTSGSKTFGTAFTSAPACVASPLTNLGTTTWWLSGNTTTLTVNLSASTSATFDYVCIGNPN